MGFHFWPLSPLFPEVHANFTIVFHHHYLDGFALYPRFSKIEEYRDWVTFYAVANIN
jgi:hypothetical protein